MWAEAVERMQQAERLQRQFFACGETVANWEPPVDIVGRHDEVLITVALPGVAPDRVKVAIDGVSLAVTALRPAPLDGHTTHIHRLEIPYGRFERRINLPLARYELVEQLFQHGCLSLRLVRHG
jgi:HSP20 family molecular chaperone IbpA